MNRQEHLEWCKQRANEYVDNGDLSNAIASFMSDMGKHAELCNHKAMEMGTMLMLGGQLETPAQMRNWINGFN